MSSNFETADAQAAGTPAGGQMSDTPTSGATSFAGTPDASATPAPAGKNKLSSTAAGAICLAVGIVLFVLAYVVLSDRAVDEASEVAQNTIAFARQSVQRNEENISSSKTKSATAVWEKLREFENRFDLTSNANADAIEQYLDYMNLDSVFLIDADRKIVRTAGNEAVIEAVADTITGSDNLEHLVAYPSNSYLARITAQDESYDYAAFSTSTLEGGVLVGVKHVERGDVSSGQAMFGAMFDNYVFSMNGAVVVADADAVLATNVASVSDFSREAFDEKLDLVTDHASGGLVKGAFDGNPCYGLSTTTNGYDLFVIFPESQVMAQRNTLLVVGVILYVAIVLAALVVRANVQNSRLRREREYTESLERANAAKTDFLRRMSHDVRTPINGIRGMLAIGDHYADDMGKQAECRGKMWEASSFLLELVNSALDMNKLESGEMRFENKPFDLKRATQSVVDVLQIQADNSGIELTSKIDIEHPCVLGSSLHVRQVLQNLGGNAIKYNRAGGTVHIEATELGAENDCVTVRFVCRDNGIGMSEEFQEHAFEAFAQEDSSSRGQYRGTGLGLAISKQIVNQMGGTIELESAKDEGSTFTVELTFKMDPDAGAGACAEAPASSESLSGLKVLLAEDNDLNAEITLFMLEQEGISADVARNGQEALERFKKSPNGHYDVVLMDVMMPVMDGYETARAIRLLDRSDAKSVPIIAVTANAFSDDRDLSMQAGMNSHVSKPLDAEKLSAAIQAARA